MLWLEILLLVGIIAYSAKLGGIGVGMAGAVGMIAATAVFGLKPGFIPVDVMLIIMTVILAIRSAAMMLPLRWLLMKVNLT